MPALTSDLIRAFKSFGASEKIGIVLLSVIAGLYVSGKVVRLFPDHTVEASSALESAVVDRTSKGNRPDCRKALWPSHLHAEFVAPARMSTTESRPVSLSVTLDPAFVALCKSALPKAQTMALRAHASLSSPAFDVAPSAGEIESKSQEAKAELRWEWLVRAKAAGTHALLVNLRGDDGLRLDMNRLLVSTDPSTLAVTEGVAMVRVRVDTELGLDPVMEAWVKGVLGVLAFFVTLGLGSGLMTKWLEKRKAAKGTP